MFPSLGRAAFDFGAIFGGFWNEISGALTGLTSHVLNESLSSVLGAFGSLTGGRIFGDLLSCK